LTGTPRLGRCRCLLSPPKFVPAQAVVALIAVLIGGTSARTVAAIMRRKAAPPAKPAQKRPSPRRGFGSSSGNVRADDSTLYGTN
jgi:hypothetical protein